MVVVALAACLIAAVSPLPGSAASQPPGAAVAKKCKKRKRHQKKRHCRRPMALPASLMISPMSQDFGMPSVSDIPVRVFTVTNGGGMPSGVPTTSVTGAGAGSFMVVADSCMAALAPGGACGVAVELPLQDPIGPKSATLTVSATPGGTASAQMTGDIEI